MYDYKIVRSRRKTVGIQINEKLEIAVRIPETYPSKKIPEILEKNRDWIEKTILIQQKRSDEKCELCEDDIIKLKKLAKDSIPRRVEHFAAIMKVKPTGIKITSAQTRFGSCNAKNSLCFSYILMLYLEEAIDYVVVHELAHIKQHNHGKKFYEEISSVLPEYKKYEKLLKTKQTKPF